MKIAILLIILSLVLPISVNAVEFTAPPAPERAETLMPDESVSFGQDLLYIIKQALSSMQPSLTEALKTCVSLIAVIILISVINSFEGHAKRTVELAGIIFISVLLIRSSKSLIQLGMQTVEDISEYGRLFLPVITAALAAEGGVTSSTALYAGTIAFDAIMISLISKLIVPLVYVFLALCIASRAIGYETLKKAKEFCKWVITWSMKLTLYIFTGYISITGVISGTADATAVKAAKLAISGSVPVVGSVVSDASETILVSAAIMKNSVGVYGVAAIIALWIGPFLKIGIQYLILKITTAVCNAFGTKETVGLIGDFSESTGFLVGMTGTVCLMLLISTVCFMKGIS